MPNGKYRLPHEETQNGEGKQPTLWNEFLQRRFRKWHPLLTPRWVLTSFFTFGVVFVGVGIAMLKVSLGVEEHMVDYTDIPVNDFGVGEFEIMVERDMEPPIMVYYQLDGFHQNHRRYLKSRDDDQMREAEGLPKVFEQELSGCKPWVLTDGRVNYPCGQVARTIFNDTYLLLARGPQEGALWERLVVDSSARTLAWPADVGKFSNLNPEARTHRGLENQLLMNMWILERFPPVVCEQVNVSAEGPYVPVTPARRMETFLAHENDGVNERKVWVTDCRGYGQAAVSCNFTRNGEPFECTGDYKKIRVSDWGIQSGHFITWMRIAGLPRFRKLWGRIDTPVRSGSIIRVHFVSNFPAKRFQGHKALVIATSSMFGGRNHFLGNVYLVVGACCLLFVIVFLRRHLMNPRKLGDVSLLRR